MPQTILVVDDERDIVELVRYNLAQAGYRVVSATDGRQAVEMARRERPDLVVLDLMLPVLPGAEVARMLKQDEKTRGIPIVMLTARGEEVDRVVGFELGADDYVVKPFSPGELVARVDAVMRRVDPPPGAEQESIVFDGLEIDPVARRVVVRGEEVQLTVREYALLHFLARHPGQVFSRDQLMDAVWQFTFYTDTSTVTVHVRRLRSKIELDPSEPRWLQTVWGVGYRFQL